MSADAYAKLVAHNNTVVQQFKTYKEAQERALAEAYSRLAALKEFCAKEREAFELEKQALILERDALILERQSLDRQSAKALDRPSAVALDTGSTVFTNQLVNKALADFFNSA